MNKTAKLLALTMPIVLTLAACADDGFDDKETWSSGVKDSQMTAPTEIQCSKTSLSDTEKKVEFSWKVVMGAAGYKVNVKDVSTPEQPKVVIADTIIDRCSFSVILPIETNFELSLLTLGNKQLNNKDAQEAYTIKFDTYLPSTTIPAGAELSSWLAENLVDSDVEQGLALEPGANYTLDTIADFRLNMVELRGDKGNAPTITLGQNGYFSTQGGLKIRDIKIDCTNSTFGGLLTMNSEPDASLSTEALGYKEAGANQDGFVIQKPVIFQNCVISNLPKSLLWGNGQNWSLADLRIQDCIIQMNSTSTKPFIDLTGASNGLIQKFLVSNTTIYNSDPTPVDRYFIRFSNASNAQPRKVFGNTNNFLEWTIERSSFVRTNPRKDLANNLPNTQNNGLLWIKITDCVFFDVYRLYGMIQSQWVKTTEGNFISYSDICPPSSTDYGPTGRTDQNGNFYSTLDETPEFDEEQLVPIDLTLPNGGVNLAPKGLAFDAKSGDPRWYK